MSNDNPSHIPERGFKENQVLKFLKCLFGFHGVTEISDNKQECRDCLKEVK